MRRNLGRRTGAALAILLSGALPALAQKGTDGVLELNREGAQTAGRFAHAGSLISFTARAESGTQASVQLEVNAVNLEATIDLGRQEAFVTGHGSALSAADRRALLALSARIDASLGNRVLGPHDELLRRAVMLWAEAPVGHPLVDRHVTASAADRRTHRERLPFEASPGGEATAACYVSDGNGITYFSCTYANKTVCHDADNGGHCWTCESRLAGCGGSCLGECGPGCAGLNIVTWDCGDHDRCCQHHGGCLNPFDSNCGDEYGEASDDFLLGWPNCVPCG